MIAGYVPQWISLREALEHVRLVSGVTLEQAWEALVVALREGAVLSRFRGQEVGGIAAAIEGNSGAVRTRWWYGATVFYDGSVQFAADRPFGRSQRREIEIQRSDLLRIWPAPRAATRTPLLAKPPPSRLKPFWEDVESAIWGWLEENGAPRRGDGNQAALERFAADWLERRGWDASESAIRRHVRACIKRYRKKVGI